MFFYKLREKYPKYDKQIKILELITAFILAFFFSCFLYLFFIILMDMHVFIDFITKYFIE